MEKQRTLDAFEEYAKELIMKHHIPGTAIGLARHGEPVYFQGFGYRDVEKQLPVTPDTVYGIASITKSFTCVAIMQLQEAGKLDVHDPVVRYLPEFQTRDAEHTKRMTIHHFMTHSAGIPPLPSLVYANMRTTEQDPSVKDYPGLEIERGGQGPIDTYEQLMAFIAQLDFELLGPPGSAFSYSNDCYALLGAIVERVSGKTYEQYVKDHILYPAGMFHSTFDLGELEDHDDITMLYAQRKNEDGSTEVYPASVWWDAPSMRAAGYLKSTVRDMLKYAEIFRNDGVVGDSRILTAESVKRMMEPYIECEPGRYYGYGLMVTPDYYGTKLVDHGGNLKAIASFLCVVPEKGISGIVLTNLAGVPASKLLMSALNDVQGKPVTAAHQTFNRITLAEEQLQQYVGSYTSNEGMNVTVGVEQGQLTFKTQGIPCEIHCVGEDIFEVTVRDQKEIIRFIKNESGQVTSIAFHFRQFPKDQT